MVFSVCVCACVGWRFFLALLRGMVGGLRVVFVGAGKGMGLSGLVLNLTFFVGFWLVGGEGGSFGLEGCLFCIFVVGVFVLGRVVLRGGNALCCGFHVCVCVVVAF